MEEAVVLYRQQLTQVEAALAAAQDDSSREQLKELQANLRELIGLTEVEDKGRQDAEWRLFQDEVGSGWSEGGKCRAPFPSCTGLHNAMISALEVDDDCATVVYVQPLTQRMRLCPHYLEGRCRFEGRCRYSHGQRVSLSELQPFEEPDFGLVTSGAVVLAAGDDQLWRRAAVEAVETCGDCHLRFEASGKEAVAAMASVWPMEAAKESEDDSEEEDDDFQEEIVARVLSAAPTSALGAWEQHTRGIGSKLMAQMGYVTGAGLGPRQEGRVEIVEATVLPAGKSLDECMRLKEEAGDGDLFKAEKRQRRLERRRLKREQTKQIKSNSGKSTGGDMFSFLNNTLAPEAKKPAVLGGEGLATELNVRGLQLEERIKKAAKEEATLARAASRGGGQAVAKKLADKRQELESLRKEEKRVTGERARRDERKKMAVF